MVSNEIRDFNHNIALFENEREEILSTVYSSSIEKIEQLCLLAIAAYKNGFHDFALETFTLSFALCSNPHDFYECRVLLRALNQTNFVFLSDKLCAILYDISENCQGDLTDKLLFKLKMFELSNEKFADKLEFEILAILFNDSGEYRVNNSLSDSLPVFLNHLIKNGSVGLAKDILLGFNEYLIEIVEQMIFESKQSDIPVNLMDFYQIVKRDEIGMKKHSELELLVSKL